MITWPRRRGVGGGFTPGWRPWCLRTCLPGVGRGCLWGAGSSGPRIEVGARTIGRLAGGPGQLGIVAAAGRSRAMLPDPPARFDPQFWGPARAQSAGPDTVPRTAAVMALLQAWLPERGGRPGDPLFPHGGVEAGLQQLHRAAMTQDVWVDSLSAMRISAWIDLARLPGTGPPRIGTAVPTPGSARPSSTGSPSAATSSRPAPPGGYRLAQARARRGGAGSSPWGSNQPGGPA
jgi:hypothetical protein